MDDDVKHAPTETRRHFLEEILAAGAVAALGPGAAKAADVVAGPSDEQLLDKIQHITFNYIWGAGHHAKSGMALERDNNLEDYNNANVAATGGTGFGIMGIIAGVERGWVGREAAADRIARITDFLEHKADTFHGVFPHWLDGDTGKIVTLDPRDDGGDLVETSFLIAGLLSARKYFSGDTAKEKSLRDSITRVWENVDWKAHVREGTNDLYWNRSPEKGHEWKVGLPIRGWNECLITYVLAAASPTHAISPEVYKGWTNGDGFVGGKLSVPGNEADHRSLFFTHYSFMGLSPLGLTDTEGNDYWKYNKDQVRRNYDHCKSKGYPIWGLTAGDTRQGYRVSSPASDNDVITLTGGLSSMPYLPAQSKEAIRYLYDKHANLWDEKLGLPDGISPDGKWVAGTRIGINQAPIVPMIENYRSGLLWGLFMSDKEVQTGLHNLGFKSPYMEKPAMEPIARLDPAASARELHKRLYETIGQESKLLPVNFTPTSLSPKR